MSATPSDPLPAAVARRPEQGVDYTHVGDGAFQRMLLDRLAAHEPGKPLALQSILVQDRKFDLSCRLGADALVAADEQPASRRDRMGEGKLGAQPAFRADDAEVLMRAAG